ncbi:hypothetical protein [Variibacter gotjawalensis]|uniref:hypothetical protein n=1 Tax=Variibacter gotjawalensis TaxID=1333996 RepID=UPI000BBA891E|nr:hypothetical protein [Variibacter gotjawalensis]NIK49330.1 hypothetical protein [Variibacter gotjawalensis]
MTDRAVNRRLDTMTNAVAIDARPYVLPPEIARERDALLRRRLGDRIVTNDAKVGLRTDITLEFLASGEPARVQRVGYCDGLVTNDLAGDVPLVPLVQSALSNHIGVSTLAITQDAKLIYQRQGKGNLIDPDTLAASASGSLDWDDVRDGESLRDLVVRGAERELSEEIGADTSASRTILTGYARNPKRGGKPEFAALTLLRQSFADLKIGASEADYVGEICALPIASLKREDILAAARELASLPNAATSLQFASAMLIDYLEDCADDDIVRRWFSA